MTQNPVPAEGDTFGYAEARARYRETGRWVLAALGAAGVAVIAGFGLADFGKLTVVDPFRLAAATIGIVLAGAGFLGGLSQALRLASESWTEPNDLHSGPRASDYVNTVNDPSNGLLGGYATFEDLSEAHVKALGRWQTERRRWVIDADRGALDLATRWEAEARFLSSVVRQATMVGATARLRVEFREVKSKLMAFGAAGILGIVLFAWAVTGQSVATEIIGPVPARATLTILPGRHGPYRPLLGEECPLDAVQVIVISPGGDAPEVIVDDPTCATVSLVVTEDLGVLRAER